MFLTLSNLAGHIFWDRYSFALDLLLVQYTAADKIQVCSYGEEDLYTWQRKSGI